MGRHPRLQQRQPDTPTYPQQHPPPAYSKIAKLRLRFIMRTTPTNNNKEVVYNIKGKYRTLPQPVHILPTPHTMHTTKDSYLGLSWGPHPKKQQMI